MGKRIRTELGMWNLYIFSLYVFGLGKLFRLFLILMVVIVLVFLFSFFFHSIPYSFLTILMCFFPFVGNNKQKLFSSSRQTSLTIKEL